MRPNTVRLSGEGADPDLVGGKGASLDRLIALGIRVPPTGVVTVHTYRDFVARPTLAAFLQDIAQRPVPPPDQIEEEHDEVAATFLAHPLPNDLLVEIEELAAVVGRRFRVAVRSSATAEDQVESSFAGQYDSYLCVDRESLSRAIRLTWASLWFPRARAYRQARGVADDDLAMAVVVMRMVRAKHAGVIFTADPGGSPRDVRIEVVEGLAEDLVSGAATPTVVIVPRDGARSYPSELAGVLSGLTDVALDIETRLGLPQDIEWAHDGRRLFIVQSRPITTSMGPAGDPFDSEPVLGATYTPAAIGEMLPGVLSPLLWSINGPLLEDAFRVMASDMGKPVDDSGRPDAMIGRFRGRAALNLTMLRQIADSVSGGAGAELERQYFGKVISSEAGSSGSSPLRLGALTGMMRATRLRRRLRTEAPLLIAAVEHVLAADIDVARLPQEELVAYRHRIRELAARVMAAESEVAATAAASFRGLEVFLERYLGDEASEWAQRLTSGSLAAAGSLAAVELGEVASVMEHHPNLADLLADGEPERSIVERHEGGPELVAACDRALIRAGSAAVYGGPTWAEDWNWGWKLVCRVVKGGTEQRGEEARAALADVERRLTSSRRWRLTRILTGQVVDLRLRLLRGLVRDTIDFLALRETTKRALLRLGGEERRSILAMATRLVANGSLADQDDVDLLSDGELEGAFLGGTIDRRAVEERRDSVGRAEAMGPLPPRFEGFPGVDVSEAVDGDVLQGWGASPGRHTGVPRVIRDLRSAHLEPGDVLVAHATDPSWTPLFLVAGAIVVEEGGPLSHAAIVARELGLPAVLHIAGAVAALEEAPSITVDGTAGTVTIHDREQASADAPLSTGVA